MRGISDKNFFIVLLIGLFFVLGLGIFLLYDSFTVNDEVCGDSTSYGACSESRPYLCVAGQLVSFPEICGCPDGFTIEGEFCVNKFMTGPKNVTLKYSFDNEARELNFIAYLGVVDYLSKRESSFGDTSIAKNAREFRLNRIFDPIQRVFLMPLAIEIENRAETKDEKVAMALNIVQSIEYVETERTVDFYGTSVPYSRYAYDVIFENQGICSGKSELLSFLLYELGFDTAIFHFGSENHEGVGIKCPFWKDYKNSGYCYLETTSVCPIGSSPEEINNGGNFNDFEILKIRK